MFKCILFTVCPETTRQDELLIYLKLESEVFFSIIFSDFSENNNFYIAGVSCAKDGYSCLPDTEFFKRLQIVHLLVSLRLKLRIECWKSLLN